MGYVWTTSAQELEVQLANFRLTIAERLSLSRIATQLAKLESSPVRRRHVRQAYREIIAQRKLGDDSSGDDPPGHDDRYAQSVTAQDMF